MFIYKAVPLSQQTIDVDFVKNTGDNELLDVYVEVESVDVAGKSRLPVKVTCRPKISLPEPPTISTYTVFIDGNQFESIWRNGEFEFDTVSESPDVINQFVINLDYLRLFQCGRGKENKLELLISYEVPIKGVRNLFQISPIQLSLDLEHVEALLTSTGEASNYIRLGKQVYYISPYCSAYEKPYKKIGLDLGSYQVLDCQYVKDNKRVFRDGRPQKGVSPDSFNVFNRVFAGSKDVILTTYGNAKVDVPSSFEVLDDGDQFIYKETQPDGYRAGYGRDNTYVYFFCESTSTPHASKVRAAKDPQSFRSVGRAYGVDEQNVYLEGRRIKLAEASSWQLLERGYSRDDKHVFYYSRVVDGADVASFIVDNSIEDVYCIGRDKANIYINGEAINQADPDTWQLLDRGYSKDAHRVFYHVHIVEGADPTSFEVYDYGHSPASDADASDNKNLFRSGCICEDNRKDDSIVVNVFKRIRDLFKE